MAQRIPKPPLLAFVVLGESKIPLPAPSPRLTPEFRNTNTPSPALLSIVLEDTSAWATRVTITPLSPLPLIVFPTIRALEPRVTVIPFSPLFWMMLGLATVSPGARNPMRADELSVITIPLCGLPWMVLLIIRAELVRFTTMPLLRLFWMILLSIVAAPPLVTKIPVSPSLIEAKFRIVIPLLRTLIVGSFGSRRFNRCRSLTV